MTKEDHRRKLLPAKGQDGAEVGVCGNENTALCCGGLENHFIVRSLQVAFANVNGIMVRFL
jgi:hypothetical protein